ncbi:MAG: carboxypeptidase-like regulatory domain-containing protein [Bryobacteraceae bacterium]|nr:carboxypeptidase-like regulatory domain-containing protein [Bryobacteraceae bacterium]
MLYGCSRAILAQDGEVLQISGLVIDAHTKAPIAGARVHAYVSAVLRSSPSPNTTSGEDGEFLFSGIEPAEYKIFASKPEYRQVPGHEIQTVKLNAGARSVRVRLVLQKAGGIRGRVIDEEKRPVKSIRVGAWVREYESGQVRFQFRSVVTTDEQGDYFIPTLAPGTYHVGTYEPRRPLNPPPPAAGLDLPAFHPNADELSQASPITIQGAEVREGVDIQTRKGRRHCVEASVVGAASADVGISVQRKWQHAGTSIADNVAFGRVAADSRFQVCSLAPGEYLLTAVEGMGLEERAFARTEFTIGKSDVSAGVLHLERAITLKLVVEEKDDERPSPRGLVTLQPSGRDSRVTETLQLRLADRASKDLKIYSGRFRLRVDLPEDTYLISAEHDNREVVDWFETRGGVLRLKVSREAARLTGTLRDSQGSPAGPGVVLLAPDPLPQDFRGMLSATAFAEGAFAFASVPPGKYRIVGVIGVEDARRIDPEAMLSYIAAGERVELAPRATVARDLKAISRR